MTAARERLALGLITALAAGLLLFRLGAPILWDDEAETALLARNVLRFGWPRATGGDRGVISQQCGADYEATSGRWNRHPWGAISLTAASFAILGETPFAARLPHALLALATVPATAFLARRFGMSRRAANLSALLLTLSITFAPYGRQCRYHAMTLLGGTLALAALPALREARWKREAGLLAVGLLLLLEASYLAFAAVFAGLAFAGPILLSDAAARRRLGATLALAALAALPLLGIQGFFSGLATQAEQTGHFFSKLGNYLLKLDLFFLPLPLLLLAALAARVCPKSAPPVSPHAGRVTSFLILFLLINLVVVSASTVAFSRYLAHLAPACAILSAWALLTIGRAWRLAAALLGILLVGSAFLNGWLARAVGPPQARTLAPFPWARLGAELIRPRPGPMTQLADYLNHHATPNATVFITHGDLPLRVHTRLRILGGESGEDLRGAPPPDWIVWRAFFRMHPRTAVVREDQERMRADLAAIPWETYERVAFAPEDRVWDNNPEPELRLLASPRTFGQVHIYRRIPTAR